MLIIIGYLIAKISFYTFYFLNNVEAFLWRNLLYHSKISFYIKIGESNLII